MNKKKHSRIQKLNTYSSTQTIRTFLKPYNQQGHTKDENINDILKDKTMDILKDKIV